MGIIARQQSDVSAYQEGQTDGAMRKGVLEGYSYPYVHDGYQGASTLGEAVERERQNVQDFLKEIESYSEVDPEDIDYLNGKLSQY